MLSIKSIGKFGLLSALAFPSGYGPIETLLHPEPTQPSAAARSVSSSTVFKELRPGVYLRADIVPADSDKEVVILAGAKIHSSNINSLLTSNVDAVYSGTFFAHNISMGDIVGYSVKDPQSAISKPFKWGEGSRTGKSIHNRFFFGIRRNGKIEIQRRSMLQDSNGKSIPAGANLAPEFQSFLGGLARINLNDSTMHQALLNSDTKKFIKQFNLDNRNYNGKAAYEGLDGYRTRPRSAIALCEDPKTGTQIIMPISIGNGRSELHGVTIMGLARHAMYVAQSHDLIVHSIALADGGGSVSYFSKTHTSQSTRPPSTAFAVKQRQEILAKK